MSFPDVVGTHIGDYFCKGEGRLMRNSSISPAFAIDLVAVKDMVGAGLIDAQEGLERMEHPGELSPVVKVQLLECLGKIAANKCPHAQTIISTLST